MLFMKFQDSFPKEAGKKSQIFKEEFLQFIRRVVECVVTVNNAYFGVSFL